MVAMIECWHGQRDNDGANEYHNNHVVNSEYLIHGICELHKTLLRVFSQLPNAVDFVVLLFGYFVT